MRSRVTGSSGASGRGVRVQRIHSASAAAQHLAGTDGLREEELVPEPPVHREESGVGRPEDGRAALARAHVRDGQAQGPVGGGAGRDVALHVVGDEAVHDQPRPEVEAPLEHLQGLHRPVGREGEVGRGHAPPLRQPRGVGVLVLDAVTPGERVTDGEQKDLGRRPLTAAADPRAPVAGEHVVFEPGARMAPHARRVGHGHEPDLRVRLDREVAVQDEVEVAIDAGAPIGVAGQESEAGEGGDGRGGGDRAAAVGRGTLRRGAAARAGCRPSPRPPRSRRTCRSRCAPRTRAGRCRARSRSTRRG